MKGFITAQRVEQYQQSPANESETEQDETRQGADQVGVCESYDALVLTVVSGVGGMENGIGGVRDGVLASCRAVEVVRKAITGERPNDEAQVWAERVGGIDRILSRDRKMGEANVVVVGVTPGRYNRVIGASVGECEAWIIAPANVPHDAAVQNLTHRQARRPLVGSGAALPVAFETNWPDGTLLLATSGLFKHASRSQIIDAARRDDLEQAAQRLAALARPSSDQQQNNLTLLLCRRESRPEEGGAGGGLLKTVGKLWNWGKK